MTELTMDEAHQQLADAAATRSLGRWLAGELLAAGGGEPALLLLQGDLGAGKTCLVQGLARGLAIEEPITSPSFALAQHYRGRTADGRATHLVHLDLYRLEQAAAADDLFAQEEEEAHLTARADRAARVVMAVEWPERLSVQPQGAWLLRLEHRRNGRLARWQPPPAGMAGGGCSRTHREAAPGTGADSGGGAPPR